MSRKVARAYGAWRGWLAATLVLTVPQILWADPWQDMSPRQRYDAMRNYYDYNQQPQERREKLQHDYERWQQLPPQEQERVRRNFEKWQRMPPEEQQRLERKYETWKRREQAPR